MIMSRFSTWKSTIMWKIAVLSLFYLSIITCESSVPPILPNSYFNITRSLAKDGYLYTSYQPTIECKSAFPPFHPTTIEDLQSIVLYALKNNYKVKAIGSLHSITDCICTEGIPVDMKQIKHFSFDPQSNYATAGAGLELLDFLDHIHAQGRTLHGLPSYGGITMGGAVGTGAHGTNLKHEATLSDQLVSITFVDGLGNIRKLVDGDEDFKALRTHLGLLGIVYELVFKTAEQYKLQIRNFPVSDDILFKRGEMIRMAENNDWFQFIWFPTNKQVVMLAGNRVPVNSTGDCRTDMAADASYDTLNGVSKTLEHLQAMHDQVGYFFVQSYNKLAFYKEIPGRTPFFSEADTSTSCLPVAVGYNHRMTSNHCKNCSWPLVVMEEGAVSLDINQFPEAVKAIKEILDSNLVGFPLVGIIFRFVKESDAYLGLSNGRRSVNFEWVSVPRFDRKQPKLGIGALQAIGQAMVNKLNARPHWGKNGLYYSNPEILQRVHPNLQKFVAVMKKMDPHEVFINDFGRRIKHGRSEMTLSSAAKKRCALNEACLCRKDSDCGNESPLALICGDFKDFKVCKNRNDTNEKAARDVINLFAGFSDDLDYILESVSGYEGFAG